MGRLKISSRWKMIREQIPRSEILEKRLLILIVWLSLTIVIRRMIQNSIRAMV